MLPEEAILIAEELALEYKGSKADYEQFIGIAMRIYERLNQAKMSAYLNK